MDRSALSFFHPLIGRWFHEKVGTPTDIQEKAWPGIAAGRHVLVTAPTGCGKTLTAFLWGLNQLFTGAWPSGGVRLLYVSPLKALNNDVQRNLLGPLADLREIFQRAGETAPAISVLTRSGDTPGEERRRMVRRPPEILITTPESLNILLTSGTGRSMLTGIRTVILDEIHAVAAAKRGTHLITAVDRLVPLSGEFQRIALSATVHPAERVAEFVAGFRKTGSGSGSRYEKRAVSVIRSEQSKSYDIRVSFPDQARDVIRDGAWWPALIDAFRDIIRDNRSTLFFTNSRRHAEKVTRMINDGEQEELAYAHHGSLAREIRLAVEQKLKQGGLKAIVATNSLELGIDIGSLDQVVLIQTPRSVSSAAQRIGRSGHSVGEKSRGIIFPIHGRDLVDAAVMARSVLDQAIEEVRPVEAPLDILAQVVLSMTASEPWDIDELYAFLRTSYPFHNLLRRHFDLVLEMLNGRYAQTRMRELKGRISLDSLDRTIEAHSEVPYLLFTSGGTIPERGYFDLRLKDNRAKIGELDEEFVWERSVGETFTLGTQLWRIEKITHNDVEVVPVRAAQGIFPFWRAEEQDRDFHFSEQIGLFLEHADRSLGSAGFQAELMERHHMEESAAEALIGFLKQQKTATGRSLPHRRHLLMEQVQDPAGGQGLRQVILHTLWGGRVNRPFALALAQAWEEQERNQLQTIVDDDGVLLLFPRDVAPEELLRLLTPETIEARLRRKLEQTGFFGARFRENAERALLLPRPNFRRRMPLWLIRRRAKDLMAAVHASPDFPILLETWRTCMHDEFDLDNLKRVLDELRDGRIGISRTVTQSASPFAGRLAWKQMNISMYEDDTPVLARQSALRPDLLKEVLFSSHLRPKIPAAVIRDLDAKLKRTAPGYAPASERELIDWIKDRLVMPRPEWNELAAAIKRDYGHDASGWLGRSSRKLAWLSWPGVRQPLLAGMESLPKVLLAFRLPLEVVSFSSVSGDQTGAFGTSRMRSLLRRMPETAAPPEEYDLSNFLGAWLAFSGPLQKQELQQVLGLPIERLDEALEPLIEAQSVVMDRISEEGQVSEICDTQNLEMLLRMARRYRRPVFHALPSRDLALFLALFQGVVPRGRTQEDLQQRLEQLFGWPAPAYEWEEFLLPARMEQYRSEWLDRLIGSTDLLWFGCGRKQISLAFSGDLELFRTTNNAEQQGDGNGLEHLIPDRRGRYSFFEIAEHSRLDPVHAAEKLWHQAWRGAITSDSFRTIRNGVMTGFRSRSFSEGGRLPSRRSGFDRWRVSRPIEGNWLRIDAPLREPDVLEQEELAKDRARQLLRRYGLLFRELAANELQPLQWRFVFRSLRLMELSGEVLSGYFFEGIPGPQFISRDAFRMLQEPLPRDAVFWINAADPASLCGIAPDPAAGLPPRVPSSLLVYHGNRLVMICRRLGRAIDILADPGDQRLQEYFAVFRDMLGREFNPFPKIAIETINGQPARRSPFADALKASGFKTVRNGLELWREYH